MIDTHAHLDSSEFDDTLDEVLTRFQNAGGRYVINCAVDVVSSHRIIAVSMKHPEVLPTVGLHPELAVPGADIFTEVISKKWIDDQVTTLSDLIEKFPRIVAIGECGLDYLFMKRERLVGREKIFADQKDLFEACIGMATEHDLPLIVHCRDEEGDKQAEAEALELLVKKGGSCVKGVFHSYTGSLHYLEDILALGFYVSFNGIITYRNADNVREILDAVPMERVLIETDAPWLVPNRRRSAGIRLCEPQYVDEVGEMIGKRKSMSTERVWTIVEENAERLFCVNQRIHEG